MVIRLVGDGTMYQKMLQDAEKQTQQSVGVITGLTHKIEGFAGGIEGFAKKALGAIAALGIGVGMWHAFHEFAESERALVKLSAAIEGNSALVATTTERYKEFAEATAAVTLHDDDAILAMLKKAEAFGVTGEAAEKATKQAIQLAAAADVDAESALRVTTAIAKGDNERAMHMARMIPQLRGMHDETKFLNEANRLMIVGEKTIAAEMGTASGRIQHMKIHMEDLTKAIGSHIVKALDPTIEKLHDMSKWYRSLDEGTQSTIATTVAFTSSLAVLAGTLPLVITGIRAATVAMLASPVTLWVVGITAASVAAYKLAEAASGAEKEVHKLNEALKEGNEWIAKQLELVSKRTSANLAQASGMEGPQKDAFLAEKARDASVAIQRYEQDIERAKRKLEEIGRTGGVLGRGLGIRSEERDEQKRILDERQKMLEAAKQEQRSYEEERKKGGVDKSLSPEVTKGIKELNDKLTEQKGTYGLSAEAAEVYKMKLKGATDAQLAFASSAAKQIETWKESAKAMQDVWDAEDKLTEGIRQLEDSTREEIVSFDMSASAKALYKLETQGATDAQLREAQALLKTKDGLEANRKLLDDAKRLTDEYATPLEKFNQKQAELAKLMDANAISTDTYNAAMKDAKKQFDDATDAAAGTRREIQRLDATMAHSAESQQRVNEFLEKHHEAVADTAKKAIKRPEPTSLKTRADEGTYYASTHQPVDMQSNLAAGAKAAGFMGKMLPVLVDIATNTEKKDWAVQWLGLNK